MSTDGRDRRLGISTAFFFLFIFYCLLSPAICISDSEGIIRAIEVEGLTRMERSELIDLICLHEGDRLERHLLSQGIRRAFKKGIFLDIKAMVEDYQDGLKLRYIVQEIPLVKDITINGNLWVSTGEIRDAFLFKEGKEFREEFIQRAKAGLITFYHRKGFINAKINIRTMDAGRNRKDILIDIEEGLPLIIKKINASSEIMKYISLKDGSIFDMDVVESDIKDIEGFYKEEGYLNPVVGPYSFQDGELTIPVKKGPRLEISFKGNQAISTKKLLRAVDIPEYEELTDEQVEDMVNVVKRLYMSRGYYYVQVAAGIERKRDLVKLRFFIAEGKRVMLKGVLFDGAILSHDVLREIIPLRLKEPYDTTILETSKESLERFYNALGYLHMKVVDMKEEFDEKGEEVKVRFVIDEGVQVRIASIDIRGNSAIGISRIRDVLRLEEGAPYNAVDIGDARYRVISLYRQHGYLDADVEVRSNFIKDRVRLSFLINEGLPSYAGKVVIRGNQKTKDEIIMREIGIKEGQRYNYNELMSTREALFRLGIFDEVSIDLIGPFERDGRLIRDMLVTVKESKAGTVDIAVGYGDYEQLRGSLEVNYRNLGGYNRQIGLGVEMNAVKNKYSLNFREPWLFNIPYFPLSLSLQKESRRVINIDTRDILYKVRRLSFIASTEKQMGRGLKGSITYEYSSVKTTDVAPGVVLSREDIGTVGISSISPSLFYDTRDNPFDPSSGSLNGVVLKFASRAILSETDFIKGIFQSSWYFRLIKDVVFACSVRGGVAHAFGDTEELPLVERFFLGGRTTVRGYSHDTLGPEGEDGSPTGGNVFALVNAEFRIPVRKGFGIVTFIDGGNVWQVVNDVGFDLRFTAGIGLRYSTPVGPIRIDYGHKLDKLPDESAGELHFSIGHAF
jgi:outer membrane protein insertion porin family